MLKKIFSILEKKQKNQLVFLFILYFPLNFIETLTLSSIPGFLLFIDNPELLKKYLNFDLLQNKLNDTKFNQRVIFGSLALILIFLLRGVVLLMVNSFGYYLKYKIVSINSKKLYETYLNNTYKFHLNNNMSKLIQNMNDSVKSTTVILAYANIIKDILLLIFISIGIFLLASKIFIQIFIFVIFPTFLIFFIVKKKLKKMGTIARNYRIAAQKSLIEGFSSIKYILVGNKQKPFLNDFFLKQTGAIKQDAYLSILNIVPRIMIEFISLTLIILFIIFSSRDTNNISSFIPELTLIVVAAVRLIPALGAISVNLNTVRFQSHTIKNINNEILQGKKSQINFTDKSIKDIKFEFKDKIILKNIVYSYTKEKIVLNNISFEIRKNEKFGIYGPSGIGKSTIVDIILGLLKPDGGKVTCDDIDITKNMVKWRNLVSFVPQNIILFDDTIKNNICFNINNKKIDETKYEKSLYISGLNKILLKMPQGDSTKIGFYGNRISGGQKQRIGIARAIYEDKPIIILDEATNSLDNDSKIEITNRLFNLESTIITISHDHEILKKCDKKFILDEK
jgi:ATP-binding cassette, subfamily B, bacterial PglK